MASVRNNTNIGEGVSASAVSENTPLLNGEVVHSGEAEPAQAPPTRGERFKAILYGAFAQPFTGTTYKTYKKAKATPHVKDKAEGQTDSPSLGTKVRNKIVTTCRQAKQEVSSGARIKESLMSIDPRRKSTTLNAPKEDEAKPSEDETSPSGIKTKLSALRTQLKAELSSPRAMVKLARSSVGDSLQAGAAPFKALSQRFKKKVDKKSDATPRSKQNTNINDTKPLDTAADQMTDFDTLRRGTSKTVTDHLHDAFVRPFTNRQRGEKKPVSAPKKDKPAPSTASSSSWVRPALSAAKDEMKMAVVQTFHDLRAHNYREHFARQFLPEKYRIALLPKSDEPVSFHKGSDDGHRDLSTTNEELLANHDLTDTTGATSTDTTGATSTAVTLEERKRNPEQSQMRYNAATQSVSTLSDNAATQSVSTLSETSRTVIDNMATHDSNGATLEPTIEILTDEPDNSPSTASQLNNNRSNPLANQPPERSSKNTTKDFVAMTPAAYQAQLLEKR